MNVPHLDGLRMQPIARVLFFKCCANPQISLEFIASNLCVCVCVYFRATRRASTHNVHNDTISRSFVLGVCVDLSAVATAANIICACVCRCHCLYLRRLNINNATACSVSVRNHVTPLAAAERVMLFRKARLTSAEIKRRRPPTAGNVKCVCFVCFEGDVVTMRRYERCVFGPRIDDSPQVGRFLHIGQRHV